MVPEALIDVGLERLVMARIALDDVIEVFLGKIEHLPVQLAA